MDLMREEIRAKIRDLKITAEEYAVLCRDVLKGKDLDSATPVDVCSLYLKLGDWSWVEKWRRP